MKNYVQWGKEHFQWGSSKEFLEASILVNGLHTILTSTGVEVDLLIKGNPFAINAKPAIVVFSGAVTARTEKRGPFFSGLGIASKVDAPVIAIADPGIDANPELALAWYTGGPKEEVQTEICKILDGIAKRTGTELLLIGGSGGGFAALAFGSMLGTRCSVFVWNPQTDIFMYRDNFVRAYLKQTFKFSNASLTGEDWKAKTRRRVAPHILHNVLECDAAKSPNRLLYIQNRSDWHVDTHVAPFVEANAFQWTTDSIARIDEDHVVVLGDFAQGHTPPPTALLQDTISRMLAGDKDIHSIAQDFLSLAE